MPPKDFFDVVNNYDPVKEVIPLAMQKFHMDMEQSKFDMAKDSFERAKSASLLEISQKAQFADEVKKLGPNATPIDLLQIGAKTQALGPAEVVKEAGALSKPISVGRGGLATQAGVPIPGTMPPSADVNKPLSDIGKLQHDKDMLLKGGFAPDHPSVKAIDDEMKKKSERPSKLLTPEEEKQRMRISKAGSSQSMQFTPEALSALSERFSQTGEIPGMGMGKAATEARTKVINQWAADLKNTGTSVQDNVARQAALKASRAELTKLQGQRGTVMAFANTAEKNLQLAGELSEKVDRTGTPVINRWLVAGKKSIAGDPDVAAFEAALRTGINEYAKVTSSATGGGVTSDSARKEVESMLNSAQTKEQVRAVMDKVLRVDLQNRRSGYDEQISLIKEAISGKKDEPKKTDFTVGGLYQGKKIKGVNKETKQLNVEGVGVVSY